MEITVPPHLVPIIQQAAYETGVPFNVLAATLKRESNFNPDARGAAGEVGISQVLPSTAARPGYGLPPITLEALRDPAQAIPWSARYLAARARGTNWADPVQAARGLARYNGAGPMAQRYGRQVAQMAGMVVPPEDDGSAPVAPAVRFGEQLAKTRPDMMQPTADDEATRQVLQILRAQGLIR